MYGSFGHRSGAVISNPCDSGYGDCGCAGYGGVYDPRALGRMSYHDLHNPRRSPAFYGGVGAYGAADGDGGIFKLVFDGIKVGAQKIAEAWKNMDPENKQAVTSSLLKQAQGGGLFSTRKKREAAQETLAAIAKAEAEAAGASPVSQYKVPTAPAAKQLPYVARTQASSGGLPSWAPLAAAVVIGAIVIPRLL